MADTTETPADEMRMAAARAREHLLPAVTARVVERDTSIVVICGNHDEPAEICRNCHYFDVQDRVLARQLVALLNAREPLASWLEETAKMFSRSTYEEPGFSVHAVCGGVIGGAFTRCACFDKPLAVARVLDGGVS